MACCERPVLLDFESRSREDLPTVGGRLYWEHASTEALCCAWHDFRTGERGVWTQSAPERRPPPGQYAAHNMMGFDRFGLARMGWQSEGPLIDTSELARRGGLPGSLEALGERLGYAKDKDASKYTKSLSSIRRPSGKKNPRAITPDVWRGMADDDKRLLGDQPPITDEVMARVVPYCERDVEVMARGWDKLSEFMHLEDDIERVDRIVNDRGMAFDRDLARALLRCNKENVDAVCRDVAEGLFMSPEEVRKIAGSPKQFGEFTGLPNAQANTLEEFLAIPDLHADKRGMILARQALSSIAGGKLEAGLARTGRDGRMRDLLRYYGARTGRWSGSGMQIQNLPRPHKRYEDWSVDDIDRLADSILAGRHCATQDEIDLLVRGCLYAPAGYELAVCDYSSIEARALAWMAGDQRELNAIRAGLDAYKTSAAGIFGIPYESVTKEQRSTVGKLSVLACGYGGGKAAVERFAAAYRLDIDKLPMSPIAIVRGWRAAHPEMVRLWQQIEDAFVLAIAGTASWVGAFQFVPSDDGRDVAVFLPSGRPIVYCDAAYYQYYDEFKGELVTTLGYQGSCDDPKRLKKDVNGVVFVSVYGGLLTENLDQALCRDLMAEGLVRAEDAGLCPVLHVHDEIVCQVPRGCGKEAYEYLRELMTQVPEWAAGFPIDGAGYFGVRYRKG